MKKLLCVFAIMAMASRVIGANVAADTRPYEIVCVTDLLTGAVIARDADTFTATFATPDTRLFALERCSPRES